MAPGAAPIAAPSAELAARPALPRLRAALPTPAEAAGVPELVADESRPTVPQAALAIAAPGHDDAGAATAVVDPPVYRTTLPPPFAFALELKRGGIVGTGILQWQLDGTRYRARLEARNGGVPLMVLDSVGGLDAAGIAPQRYLDRRRGRGSAQAANFQRDAGKVTFSGPAVEAPLPPGTQDRLSWMLQLAAIAEAEPALVGPGGRVSFLVVGARGDADLWTFVHVGPETLALPEGDTPTLHLVRLPQRSYDTRADVWLDPARHHLPVRARLANAADANALQLSLREVLAPP